MSAADMTPALREVYALLVQGLTDAEIAAARGSAVNTIGNQVVAVRKHFGARNRTALVALHHGVLEKPWRPEVMAKLTPRQVEALRLRAEGRTNQEAARAMGVSVSTVALALAAVAADLGVDSTDKVLARLVAPEGQQ